VDIAREASASDCGVPLMPAPVRAQDGVSWGCLATLASLAGVHWPTSPGKRPQSSLWLQYVIKATQNRRTIFPLALEDIIWKTFF